MALAGIVILAGTALTLAPASKPPAAA